MRTVALSALSAPLALEVDALCDQFERRWHWARRRGQPLPRAEMFLPRVSPEARPALSACLAELDRELLAGPASLRLPGLVVEEEIGRGGMGVVYRARRPDGRAVAVKLIQGPEHRRWTRWLGELVDLRHPNLVPLEGFGSHDGLYFVVMPLVPGGDLRERFEDLALRESGDQGRLRSIARLTEKVARAVAFLHHRGILHRDLKPSNILLAGPDSWEPLVGDFGLAGRLDEGAAGIMGTPAYMAPEQKEGLPLTVAADLWSLGAVLHELLTGRLPAGEVRPDDGPLHRIASRCLHDDPARRYPSADAVADDLLRFLDGPPLTPLRDDP